jgi:hypothetical protein
MTTLKPELSDRSLGKVEPDRPGLLSGHLVLPHGFGKRIQAVIQRTNAVPVTVIDWVWKSMIKAECWVNGLYSIIAMSGDIPWIDTSAPRTRGS